MPERGKENKKCGKGGPIYFLGGDKEDELLGGGVTKKIFCE